MYVYSVSSDETKILTAESEITKFYRGKFYCLIIADYKMLHITDLIRQFKEKFQRSFTINFHELVR